MEKDVTVAKVDAYKTRSGNTRYAAMFEKYPGVRVEPGWRTEVGSFVVQEETVTGRAGHERHVAVYQVENDLIVRERFIA